MKEILVDNIDVLCSGNEGMSFFFLSHITITNPEGQSQLCDIILSATPTNLFARLKAVNQEAHLLKKPNNHHFIVYLL